MQAPGSMQRRVTLVLLFLQLGCSLVGLIYFAALGNSKYEIAYTLIVTAMVTGVLALYLRGHQWARYLSVIGLTVASSFFLPGWLIGPQLPLSFFVPPVYALIVAEVPWIIGSAVFNFVILGFRAGWAGHYSDPIVLAVLTIVVGGMALSRLISHIARAAVERQAHTLEQERALLAEHVAERTRDLQAANEALLRASDLKDAFLANISHELRTPLNIIIGNLDLLAEGVYGPLGDRQRRSVEVMSESGQHLLNLISDLLDLARMEAGHLAFAYEDVLVRDACDSCLSLIRPQAARKNIRVEFQFDPAVGSIRSDPHRLRQILLCLLNNAVKFTPADRAIGLQVRLAPQGDVVFIVWDEGVGIAPKDIGRLFEPFTQLDDGLARQYEGTGTGLALVRRLVDLHSGQIMVESAPNQGSRFTVILPIDHQG